MWWDLLCDQVRIYTPENRHGDTSVEEAIFKVLIRILEIDDERTQKCALHGLGHLHYHGTAKVIDEYIKNQRARGRKFDKYELERLRECADGTVM